jgi:hypothetical protein
VKRLLFFAACVCAVLTPIAHAAYSLAPYQVFTTGSWPDTVAIGDVNGDGRNDVVMTTTISSGAPDAANDYKVFVFLQTAGGALGAPLEYSYQSTAYNTGLVLADLDHDGRMDIIVGRNSGLTVLQWRPNRDGGVLRARLFPLANPIGYEDVVALALLDINRDGATDVVGTTLTHGIAVYFGDGHGGLGRQATIATPDTWWRDLKTGDFNGDGFTDLAVISASHEHSYVFYNNGADTMSAPLELNSDQGGNSLPAALASGDFNGDGKRDLVSALDAQNVVVFKQDSNGVLQGPTSVPTASATYSMVGTDLNLDGLDDLVVQHSDGLGLYLQGVNGLSAETLPIGPSLDPFNSRGVATGDINGDQCPDVVVSDYSSGLIVYPASGCDPVADLSLKLNLTAASVALRVDNLGMADAAAPETTIALSVIRGSLSVGALPTGCTVDSQSTRSVNVTCTGSTLAAGANRTLVLPVFVDDTSSRNTLSASGSVNTTSVELALGNNSRVSLLRLH